LALRKKISEIEEKRVDLKAFGKKTVYRQDYAKV
jgi:hypothetical protein